MGLIIMSCIGWISVINPLTAIIFISPYRQAIVKKFQSFYCPNSVQEPSRFSSSSPIPPIATISENPNLNRGLYYSVA
uniref:NADH:ubiquinone reductase (H(+)-translocating) n=1 Tax=Acrobeloides nanus TaxID=290746 RepID=A0A914E3D9_9BILA